MNRRRIAITACASVTVAALLLFLTRVAYQDQHQQNADPGLPLQSTTTNASEERPSALVKSSSTRHDRVRKRLDEVRNAIRNTVPRSAEDVIRYRYADIVPQMTPEQFELFTGLLKKHDDMLTKR
jgi:hypothetical protein